MPSPALAKLEQLPRTPLSSAPGSPNRSQPGSRRGSSSASSLRRPSMAAGAPGPSNLGAGAQAPGIGPMSVARTSTANSNSSSASNLHALTSISQTQTQAHRQQAQPDADDDGEIEQAVAEEDMCIPGVSGEEREEDCAIASSSSDGEGDDGPRRRRSNKNGNGPAASSSLVRSPVLPQSAAGLPSSSTSRSPPRKKQPLSPIESAKRSAARRAVDAHVRSEHKVIGIGSGSTVPYVVERLCEGGEEENRMRWFVPTGFQSKELIVNAGLKLADVDQFPKIDVTIDGADDVDLALNAIKGGGACHLREKVLAEAADEFVIIADYRKNNVLLGDGWKKGIPIETPPFAYSKVLENLRRIPGCIEPVLRMAKAKAGPCVTDNGNFVIDAVFDEAHMREPDSLFVKLKLLTGVVEVGLFCSMARAAYFGNEDGSVTVRWSDGQEETLQEGEPPTIRREHIDTSKRLGKELLTVELEEQPNGQEDAAMADTHTGREELSRKLEQLKMTST